MTEVKVFIRPFVIGKPETHRVVVLAEIAPPDAPARSLRAEALRFVDGKERSNSDCLEAAVADILRQILAPTG